MTYSKRDAAEDVYQSLVDEMLDVLVTPMFEAIVAGHEPDGLSPSEAEAAFEVWQEFGDDGLREYLEEGHREEAEELAQAKLRDSYEEGPCCSSFSCPCGNSNSFRGI